MEPVTIFGAIGHLVGAAVALSAIGFGLLAVSSWELQRNRRIALQEASLELGVPVDQLDEDRWRDKVTAWAVSRSSSELLRNRLSDLCGTVRTAWSWLGALAQWGVFLIAAWLAFTDDPASAVIAWGAIPLALFVTLTSAVFSIACKVLTGRYPGQAREMRKTLAQLSAQRPQ
jgi:hypothetical protein